MDINNTTKSLTQTNIDQELWEITDLFCLRKLFGLFASGKQWYGASATDFWMRKNLTDEFIITCIWHKSRSAQREKYSIKKPGFLQIFSLNIN